MKDESAKLTWVSHVHLMGITCTPHGYHMYTSWVSHVHLMGITCTPHGYHMYTSWVSHVHLMDITCTPHGHQIHTPPVVHFTKIFHNWLGKEGRQGKELVRHQHAYLEAESDERWVCKTDMGITCTPHGYHMYTSWVSHVHLMGITCTPHGYHMYTSWISHVHLMGIRCTPHGYHMYTSWISHVHLMGIRCTPHGYHMYTSWISHVHLMGIRCTPHGYHMYTSWVSDAHHMDITCTPHGLELAGEGREAGKGTCKTSTCISGGSVRWKMSLQNCTPHGYHMYTSWVSDAHHMDITCRPHGYQMHTTWISDVHLMGIRCAPHGYHMYTSWVSHVHLMSITCTPHGYHMYTSWASDSHSPCGTLYQNIPQLAGEGREAGKGTCKTSTCISGGSVRWKMSLQNWQKWFICTNMWQVHVCLYYSQRLWFFQVYSKGIWKLNALFWGWIYSNFCLLMEWVLIKDKSAQITAGHRKKYSFLGT